MHPPACRHVLLSINSDGGVYVWAFLLSQNWDVFAPGFRSLTRNEEYVESETEFDINELEEKGTGKQLPEPDKVPTCDLVRARHLLFGMGSKSAALLKQSGRTAIAALWCTS